MKAKTGSATWRSGFIRDAGEREANADGANAHKDQAQWLLKSAGLRLCANDVHEPRDGDDLDRHRRGCAPAARGSQACRA
jgi:hypothetical protein